jgi:hypothetical protein
MMILYPFALSLSKGCTLLFPGALKKVRCFDKLGTNGSVRALRTSVGVGMRGPVTVSPPGSTSRHPPQLAPMRRNSSSPQSTAAPIPRAGSVCEDSVCRVPMLTSLATSF